MRTLGAIFWRIPFFSVDRNRPLKRCAQPVFLFLIFLILLLPTRLIYTQESPPPLQIDLGGEPEKAAPTIEDNVQMPKADESANPPVEENPPVEDIKEVPETTPEGQAPDEKSAEEKSIEPENKPENAVTPDEVKPETQPVTEPDTSQEKKPLSKTDQAKTEPARNENTGFSFAKIFGTSDASGLYAGLSGEFDLGFSSFLQTGKGVGVIGMWKQSPYFAATFRLNTGLFDLKTASFLAADSQKNLFRLNLVGGYSIGYFSGSLGVMATYPFFKIFSAGLGLNFNLTQFQGSEFNFGLNPGFEIEPAIHIQVFPFLVAGGLVSYRMTGITKMEYKKQVYTLNQSESASSLQVLVFVQYRMVKL